MSDYINMITPTDTEVREALEEYAAADSAGRWAFLTHPMNVYSEAEALKLTRVNLMLGTTPNGSITADMLERIVDRIAAVETRLRDLELFEESRHEHEMGDDI